ncbi:MAG: hypothetical protein LBU94_03170 [Clostridiales bacterium]|jgi:hypothetical protein|nr:hypothetical protein [Clostridiales bacterium]
MIERTDRFNVLVKEKIRRPLIKIIAGDTVISGNDIFSAEIKREAPFHIGGTEYKKARVVLKKESLGELLNTKFKAQIHIGFEDIKGQEYVNTGWYCARKWNIDGYINKAEVELWGLTNELEEGPLPDLPVYEKMNLNAFASILLPGAVFNGLDDRLDYAFLYDDTKNKVYSDIAKAMNAILTYEDRPVFKSYSTNREESDSISQQDIYSLTGGLNGARSYEKAYISLSVPYKSDRKQLTRLSDRILPGYAENCKIGDIKFTRPSQAKQVIFKGETWAQTGDYKLSSRRFNMLVSNNGPDMLYDLSVNGYDFLITVISDVPEETKIESIFEYTNCYIQNKSLKDNIDTGLLTDKRFSLKYPGNPAYEPGDIIHIEGLGKCMVTITGTEFKKGLTGSLEGVVLDG